MNSIKLILTLQLLGFSAVTSLPCSGVISCTQSSPGPAPESHGSLTLHYTDDTRFKIDFNSSSPECRETVTNLPKKRIAKVEVASASFILHNNKKTNGLQKQVGSVGSREYSAEDVGFTKVRAVIILNNSACAGRGGTANAKVPLIVVCVLVGVISLVLAAVLLISRTRTRYQHRPLSSEEQTPFRNQTIVKEKLFPLDK